MTASLKSETNMSGRPGRVRSEEESMGCVAGAETAELSVSEWPHYSGQREAFCSAAHQPHNQSYQATGYGLK